MSQLCLSCQTAKDSDARVLSVHWPVCEQCETRWIETGQMQPAEGSITIVPGERLTLPARSVVIDSEAAGSAGRALTRITRAPKIVRIGIGVRPSPGVWRAALIGVVALTCVAQRERLVRLTPPTARIFAAIGMPVNLRGFVIERLQPRLIAEGERRTLAIEGEIANIAPGTKTLPDLRLAVRQPGGHEVYVWQTPAPQASLERGGRVTFRVRLIAPPIEGTDVEVRFADATAVKLRLSSR